MKHRLYTSIPESLDRRLRWQFRRLLWQERLLSPWTGAFGAAVVYLVFFVLFAGLALNNESSESAQLAELRQSVFTAQAAEIERAQAGIYHVRRMVSEGADKPAFVASRFGTSTGAPLRVDVVETWQHNENARAEVRSTAHRYPTHTYLSRADESQVDLYLDQGPETEYPKERVVYDEAHDLGSLYQGFATTAAPSLPTIPESAQLVSRDPLVFKDVPQPELEVMYEVDPNTLLVTRERIYVLREGERYEMSTVTYLDRTVEPAEQFDEVFTPETTFTRLATASRD